MDPIEVQQYIRSQSAVFFDARIVDVFLGMGDLSSLSVSLR
jgi:hypothetical protein